MSSSDAVERVSTAEEASARAHRIRDGLDSLHVLRVDIAEAYRARDWDALGHDSWSSYVDAEFVGARLRLPRDERRELVGSLREAGMSTRAIASATGSSRNTVKSDLRDVGQSDPPGPPPVTGLDGKTYTPREKPTVTDLISADDVAELNGEPSEPIEAEIVDDEPQEVKPKPSKQRTHVVNTINRMLTRANEAADAADELTKRHLANRADEAAQWERNLTRHLESLERFRDLLQEVQA